MKNAPDLTKEQQIENSLIFVGTIYDTFDALEETLGKLKLATPLFITHVAKQAFAEALIKQAEKSPKLYTVCPESNVKQKCLIN